jgi:hypothetical protein
MISDREIVEEVNPPSAFTVIAPAWKPDASQFSHGP